MTARYAAEFPDWQVCVGSYEEPVWVKAKAIERALEQTDSDILILADADVWTDGIGEAVDAVRAGEPYAIPHHRVWRLTEEATENVLAGRPDDRTVQIPYPGVAGGGIMVTTREVIRSIPLDGRFFGWGRPVKRMSRGAGRCGHCSVRAGAAPRRCGICGIHHSQGLTVCVGTRRAGRSGAGSRRHVMTRC